MIRVEFDSSSFQLTIIVWMRQVSGIVTALPELIPEAVSGFKRLFCPEGKSLATIAKCLLPFKKLWDMHLENVCFEDYLVMEDTAVVHHELSDVVIVILVQLHSHARVRHFFERAQGLDNEATGFVLTMIVVEDIFKGINVVEKFLDTIPVERIFPETIW